MSIYQEVLLNGLDNNDIPLIPNQLDRLSTYFNIVPSRYTLIGSVSGAGKTSFVDDVLLLKPYEWLKRTNSDIYFEGLYFSMERKLQFKLAKFASWKLFTERNIRITADTILGYSINRKLLPMEKHIIERFKPWMDELLETVDIKDGAKTVAEVAREIRKLGEKLGDLFETDEEGLSQNGNVLVGFKDKWKQKKTKRGLVDYIAFTFKDKRYVIEKNSKLFVPHNPKMIILIIVDHIGKIKTDGYVSKKQAIDALDFVLSEARDVYGFSPIVISQFNRSVSDIHRLKYAQGDLEPIVDDFKDSSNTVESADLVLSIFNPFKYKSYNERGEYKGYNILHGMLTPNGSQRFRSLHVLKNSFGTDIVTMGLRFTGECMYFSTLPKLDDTARLTAIYESIARGN